MRYFCSIEQMMRFLGHLSKSWLVQAKLKKKKKKKREKNPSAWNKWECCKMTEILLNNLDFFQPNILEIHFFFFLLAILLIDTQHLLLRVLSLTYNKNFKLGKEH